MRPLLQQALDQALPYPAYRQHLTDLLARGKTTGSQQTPVYLDAATLNQSRMDRLDRKPRFTPAMETALAALDRDYTMLVLTEGWCGDAAQTVPLMNHMAEASAHLELRLVLRDQHTELMDHFPTDGGRGIPKLLFLDPGTLEVAADWGPRPAPAQQLAMDYKYQREPKMDYEQYNKALHTWYARDKTKTTQDEMVNVLERLE